MKNSMSQPNLMILDGESRATLGIVRSLGTRGIPIIVGSNDSLGRSGFSKYVQKRFTYPSTDNGLYAAHKKILEQVRNLKPDILMPVFDQGWDIIHTYYEEYESIVTIVPNPGKKLYQSLSNKKNLTDYATKNNVPIPVSYNPKTIKDAYGLKNFLPYPVILKPNIGTAGSGISKANNEDQFLKALDNFQEAPLIQEYIMGEDLELTILCAHGEPIAGSAYLSLRNAPLPFGPPVACISIKDDNLIKIGCDFLKSIEFHGVGHLDFRRDQRDGIPKLFDFNVRVAGTNDISIKTGVDFGFMLYQLASGEKIDNCFDYEIGREFRWYMPGELRYFLQTHEKLKTIKNWMKWDQVSTDFSLSDPIPQAVMLVDLFGRACRKLI